MKPDFNYRPNPDRAIFVLQEFNHALLEKIIPRLEIFKKTDDPITIYINSFGGDIDCLQILDGLLSLPDVAGKTRRIITCAAGEAKSAAAMLLVLGDYSLAYPHANIHFHGIRVQREVVTFERASRLAQFLSQQNELIASNLAESMLGRLVSRYTRSKNEFVKISKELGDQASFIKCFGEAIKRKTVANSTNDIIDKSVSRVERFSGLLSIVDKARLSNTRNPLEQDVRLLRQVVKFEIRDNIKRSWRLDEGGVGRILQDYFLLREFLLGTHIKSIRGIIKDYGKEFLNENQLDQLGQLEQQSDSKAKEFLEENTFPIVFQFWYFIFGLCRNLSIGENPLTAQDAYWIGAIDEVIGIDDLYGMRMVAESENDPNQLPLSK